MLLLKLTSDASVRGMMAPNGDQRYSVFDFMNVACQKSDGGIYSRKTYSNLVRDGSEFKDEIEDLVIYLQFPGSGQRHTPTMTLRGLQRLLCILGGKVAAEYRALLEGTFTRVMAGDRSLIEIIQANAASDAPVHQAFRQALAQEPVVPGRNEDASLQQLHKQTQESVEDTSLKRKREEIELQKMEISSVKEVIGLMDLLNPEWKTDANLCCPIQHRLVNIVSPTKEPVQAGSTDSTRSSHGSA